ncbi:hypothetical protein [Bradyrhizobium sp. SZCCHNRI1073]|uniref:hypothetical protein n=1 Tax=Bradyrhizobium sp. SZCCHNRI1073 TaxID=3057280 RepID=UPI002915E608|nr:hypothetical protein [Bradyrhizobium sp. SZCCHNRI1073]
MMKFLPSLFIALAQVFCALHEGWTAAIFALGAANILMSRYLPDDQASTSKEVER